MSNQLQPPSIATMSVKAYTQEGIRRFRVPMEPRNGFEIFLAKITIFVSPNCVKPIVKWQDSDGDFITIDVIDDFIEAVSCLDKGGTLKVFVNDCTIHDVPSRQSSAAPSLTDIPPTGTWSSANRTSPVPAFSVGSRLADNASLSVSVSPTVEARNEQQFYIEPNDVIPTSQNQRMEENVQRTTTTPPPLPSTFASAAAAAADIFVVAEDNDKGNGAPSSSETKNDDNDNDNDELPQRSYSSEILQSVFSAIECGALELNEGFRKLETHLKGLESHIYQNLSEKLAQAKEQGYWETSATTKTTRTYDDEDNGSGIPAQSHPDPHRQHPHHHREHPVSHHHRHHHHRSPHQPHHRHGYDHGQHHQHSDRRGAEKHNPKNVGTKPTSKYSSLARDVASSSSGRAYPPATNKSILRPLDVKEEATTSKPLATPSYHTQYPTTASSAANHQGEKEMESAPIAVSATNEVTPSSVSRVRDFSVQIQSLKQMGFQESDVYLTDLLWAHGGSVSEVIETLIH